MLIAGIGLNFLDSAWVVRVSNEAIARQVAAALLVFTLPKTMPTERKYEGEICPDLGSDIVVVPILLGRGVRVWDGLEGLEQDYRIETTSSPSGVTHINSHVRVSDHGARVHQCSRRSPSAWLTGPSVRGLSLRGRRIRRVRRPPAAVSVSPGVRTRCGGSRGRNDAP